MTIPFSAGAQALGYLFQARRALYVILRAPEGSEIIVEGLDDVALTHPGGRLDLEQLKHHITAVDADIAAVTRMFDFLFDFCVKHAPDFQVIVTEHANLPSQRFQDALVEAPWTDNRALIPSEWF